VRGHRRPARTRPAVEDAERSPASPAFGMLLRRYRLAAGLSQEALAERARMSANGVGALERGDRRTPQRETLILLEEALTLGPEQRRAFEAAATRPGARRPGIDNEATRRPSNLPLALTSFVGRDSELGEIVALVRGQRMVTLTGTGGVGKTRTALEVGTALGDIADDGLWLVELAPLADPKLVVAAIATALRVQELPNRPLIETLTGFLRQKRALVILDNCEHVVAEAANVADALLRGCSELRILATSREALRVAGEHTYRLPSLDAPSPEAGHRLRAADAGTFGAITLFAERAQSVDHRFALTDANAPIVAEICRRLDGIPLAIELAAARVRIIPVNALSQKLDQRFRILTGGDRTALPRQQTMRALIDWSYDLLAPAEQRMFERLSVFAGGCTLATATAVCGALEPEGAEQDVFELLASLVDKSLVVADFVPDEPRYRLLESSREYVREKLAARGETDSIARRHAAAFLRLAEELERSYETDLDPVWRRKAEDELDNWRAALEWALAGGADVARGQRLVGELSLVWTHFARVEGRRWIALGLSLAGDETARHTVATLRYAEACIARWLSNLDVQLASGEQALAQYRQLGDPRGVARAQGVVGHALVSLRRSAEAEPLLREALAAARQIGHRPLVASLLRTVAFARAMDGDVDAARANDAEALAIYEELGATASAARTLAQDLCAYEYAAGNFEVALRHAADALAMFRRLGDADGVARALVNVSICLVALARYDEAERGAIEALDLTRYDGEIAWPLQQLGTIGALRRHATAKRALEEQTRAARLMGFVDTRIAALGIVRWATGQKEYERVIGALREALGSKQLESLMAAGAAMTDRAAIDEALRD